VVAWSGDFTGVRGRAAWNDNTAAGVIVYAYREFDRGFPGDPVAVSSPTPPDGAFSLELPAGNYILAAVLTAGGRKELRTGDRFCFFGGNPVRVNPGRATVVGLNLSVVADDPAPDVSAGISGVVYDERGKPLPGATVYLYKTSADGFKGMPGMFARTQGDGTFRLRIRKGTFFVIARKRESGDLFGPTRPGDSFGYYARNPVVLTEGERRGIRIDALPRQVMEEKFGEGYERPQEILVRVKTVDPEGRPLAGVRVLAYRTAPMTGFPAFVSGKTGADGEVELAVVEEGRYYLLARERLGGPADGEWYGKYTGAPDHSVNLSRGVATGPLTIVLEKR
jgi:protocatechuate 3,4-dioxygenase beta subunit